jgi:hypothetical protein
MDVYLDTIQNLRDTNEALEWMAADPYAHWLTTWAIRRQIRLNKKEILKTARYLSLPELGINQKKMKKYSLLRYLGAVLLFAGCQSANPTPAQYAATVAGWMAFYLICVIALGCFIVYIFLRNIPEMHDDYDQPREFKNIVNDYDSIIPQDIAGPKAENVNFPKNNI